MENILSAILRLVLCTTKLQLLDACTDDWEEMSEAGVSSIVSLANKHLVHQQASLVLDPICN